LVFDGRIHKGINSTNVRQLIFIIHTRNLILTNLDDKQFINKASKGLKAIKRKEEKQKVNKEK